MGYLLASFQHRTLWFLQCRSWLPGGFHECTSVQVMKADFKSTRKEGVRSSSDLLGLVLTNEECTGGWQRTERMPGNLAIHGFRGPTIFDPVHGPQLYLLDSTEVRILSSSTDTNIDLKLILRERSVLC